MNQLPRIDLAYLPTPVEQLTALSRELGGPELFIKRDDLTGLAFGGNKSRKLEYLLSDALNSDADTLVTAGAVQSNHCRQTAAAAAKVGLGCTLVLAGHPPEEASGNVLLDLILGADLVWAGDKPRDLQLTETFQALTEAGKQPYLIPYGGSNVIGASAFAYAVGELKNQGFHPDWIVFPTSSGGTQAGLAAGVRLFNMPSQVLGISVDEPAGELSRRVAALSEEVCSHLGSDIPFDPDEILVNEDYLGAGYGLPEEIEIETIQRFARIEGILLDPVYSGRAAAGLCDLISKSFFKKEATVLFWHTGGTPAIFADRYQDLFSASP